MRFNRAWTIAVGTFTGIISGAFISVSADDAAGAGSSDTAPQQSSTTYSKRVHFSESTTTGPETSPSTTGKDETVEYSRGVRGAASANVFAPKFRERIKNLKEQMDLGISKGWLSAEQIEQFKQEHAKVDAFEVEVAKKGFPADEVAKLEAQVTALNHNLSVALTKGSQPKPATPASTTPTPAAVKPAPAAAAAKPAATAAKPAATSQVKKPPKTKPKPTKK